MYFDTIFPYWLGSFLGYPGEECHFIKHFVLKRKNNKTPFFLENMKWEYIFQEINEIH